MENEIDVVKYSYERINYTAKSRSVTMGLINMANGFEPTYTPILPDRWESFRKL